MSAFPPSVLAVMFAYQPPNDDTAPKYRAVGMARDTFEKEVDVVFAEIALQEGEGSPPDFFVLHKEINDAALAYATALNGVLPHRFEAFVLDAFNAVVFAQMWANKALHAPAGPIRGRLVSLAKTESEKAQLAANNAIALYLPVRDAYTIVLAEMEEAERQRLQRLQE